MCETGLPAHLLLKHCLLCPPPLLGRRRKARKSLNWRRLGRRVGQTDGGRRDMLGDCRGNICSSVRLVHVGLVDPPPVSVAFHGHNTLKADSPGKNGIKQETAPTEPAWQINKLAYVGTWN